jgi:hypothetical protein
MRRFGWILVIVIGLLLAGCGTVDTAPPLRSSDLTADAVNAYYALRTLDDLQARDVLDADTLTEQRDYYLAQASDSLGQPVTQAQLEALVFEEGQGWWRFVSFVNIIWLFASLMIVLALIYIFARYIFPLLTLVPVTVYEILLYVACFGLMYVAWAEFEPDVGQFVVMPALFGLIPLMPWSYARHVIVPRQRRRRKLAETRTPDEQKTHSARWNRFQRRALLVQYAVLLVIYSAATVIFESEFIGFFSVMVLLVVLGLAGLPELIATLLRMEMFNALEEIALIVSGAMMLIYMAAEVYGFSGAYLYFGAAIYYIGTYVYFTVLAVIASRFYPRERDKFWLWQSVAVASGIGALFLGTMLEIDTLLESGGTFLLVYLLTKYVEMLDWRRHWAWAMLGLGLLLYGIALLVNQYPSYFLLG